MKWVIAYDICDPRRLQRVAKVLKDYGVRVQKSVFEAELSAREQAKVASRLRREIDPDLDGVKFYPLCGKCEGRLWSFGPEAEGVEMGNWKVL